MNIGVFEARNRFSELLDAAERGEEVTVLRHGKPIVRMIAVLPVEEDLAERRRRALAALEVIGEQIAARNGRVFTHEELMAARDEGRR
jgi:prevent-host-death family protein